MKKKIFLIGLLSMLLLTITGCNIVSKEKDNKVYGFDEKFEYDDLEVTIGKDYSFDVIHSQYSDLDGSTVIRIPITVKNLGEDTNYLNTTTVAVYGPNGTTVDEIASYYDDSITEAGNLLNGASYTKYMYVVYDGDGKYTLEFGNREVKVEINIKK